MTENLTILVCINNLGVGGAERLVVDDINEILRRGLHVRLLTFKKEPANSLASFCHISKEHWKLVPFRSLFNISDMVTVYRYIKQEKPDIVLNHLWFSNAIIRTICKFAGVKNVINFEHNVYDSVKTRKMYMLDRFLQRWCRIIVAVSEAVKKSLISHGIEQGRIVVVQNGIDISAYKTEKNLELKEKLGVPKDAFIFLTIGRLIRQKGMDVLLNAFAHVKGNEVLLIVGQGSEEEKLKEQAHNLGIAERVRFLGVRRDVPEILSLCDVFVLASRWEGLGIVVLEAMASKKAIIISDFEAGIDMITSGEQGLIVKKENMAELAEAMTKLMNDSVLRDTLAEKAYKKVHDFSIQNHVSKILSL